MTPPLAVSTATTLAPKTPVPPGGAAGSDKGLADRIRPLMDPTSSVSAGSGYKTGRPVRSSSPKGASGCSVVGLAPEKVPGGGAKGYIIAFQTAVWLNPRAWPNCCVSNDSRS
jgi:hypothetical protein